MPNPENRLGDYEVIERIGCGGEAKVFRARCVVDGNPNVDRGELVALKVLTYSDDDSSSRRFQQRIGLLQSLNHPNIVRYRDSFAWRHGEWDERHCLVMDLLEGETLEARLARGGKGLPWTEVRRIFEGCLEGLIYTRSQNVVHLDLKPSNIFLANDGRVMLIDFGIARRMGSAQTTNFGWRGSFDYMAPDFAT